MELPEPAAPRRAAALGLTVAVLLIVLAVGIPALTGWQVYVQDFPPLHAGWQPRVGPGTLPAIAIALLAGGWAVPLAERLPWRRLLPAAYAGGLAWMLSLAFVDGTDGVGKILESSHEYLRTARRTTDLHHTLEIYAGRINGLDGHPWPVHIAGHPPGALTFFVVLVRLGLGSSFAAGVVISLLAASTAIAVLVTLRVLGAEDLARRAAPFLVFGPAAIWQCVSADGMFAAVAAWGLAALALAATRTRLGPVLAWSVLSGLLLGYCVMLSYGLPLLGFLALAILVITRSWRPLLPTAVAAAAVVLGYAAFGFRWWEAYPQLHDRYWAGVARHRPASYFLWANFAALACSAGPLLGAGLAEAGSRWRRWIAEPATRVVLLLVASASAAVVAADLSLMSKAEVERIWLPFAPWLLLSCALLPERWRRRGLFLQLGLALTIQHLLNTGW